MEKTETNKIPAKKTCTVEDLRDEIFWATVILFGIFALCAGYATGTIPGPAEKSLHLAVGGIAVGSGFAAALMGFIYHRSNDYEE